MGWDVLGLDTFMFWAEVNVVLNNVMLPVLLVRGFGFLLSHLWCTPWDKVWNHRMNIPFLPSRRTLCLSPIWSYCSSPTDGICAFLLSPSTFPSLCRIWHGWDMGTWWVWFVVPSGQAPGVTVVCRWTRQTSVKQQKSVPQPLKSSQLGLISPLSVKLHVSEITATFILWIFSVYWACYL